MPHENKLCAAAQLSRELHEVWTFLTTEVEYYGLWRIMVIISADDMIHRFGVWHINCVLYLEWSKLWFHLDNFLFRTSFVWLPIGFNYLSW